MIARTNPLPSGVDLAAQSIFPRFNIPIVLFASLTYYISFNSAIIKDIIERKKTKEMIWYSIGIVVYGAMFIVSYFFAESIVI